jgi:hypothetical protein
MTEASHETDSAAVPERELVDKPPFGHFLPLRITCKVRPRATGERDRAWVRNAEYRRPGVERTSFGWLLLAPCWDFALPPREVPPPDNVLLRSRFGTVGPNSARARVGPKNM